MLSISDDGNDDSWTMNHEMKCTNWEDTKPVSEEADKRGSDEYGEWENCVDQGDVDVADADVLEDIVIA